MYAGPESKTQGGNPWRANYLRDSTGLFGPPGQWYELPREINLGVVADASGTLLKKLADEFGSEYASTLQKVTLEKDTFVAS